jgi:hypothetical protein
MSTFWRQVPKCISNQIWIPSSFGAGVWFCKLVLGKAKCIYLNTYKICGLPRYPYYDTVNSAENGSIDELQSQPLQVVVKDLIKVDRIAPLRARIKNLCLCNRAALAR